MAHSKKKGNDGCWKNPGEASRSRQKKTGNIPPTPLLLPFSSRLSVPFIARCPSPPDSAYRSLPDALLLKTQRTVHCQTQPKNRNEAIHIYTHVRVLLSSGIHGTNQLLSSTYALYNEKKHVPQNDTKQHPVCHNGSHLSQQIVTLLLLLLLLLVLFPRFPAMLFLLLLLLFPLIPAARWAARKSHRHTKTYTQTHTL